MTLTMRLATAVDADAIAEIYAPFCTDTIVSFEYVAPSPDDMAARIRQTTVRYPWLILDEDGTVAGYAYAGQHSPRTAYQWSADVTAYIAATYRRRGVGRALYTSLLAALRCQGFYKAFGGISLPNEASVGLHLAMGMDLVGVYRGVGYKFGAWHDVGWYGVDIQPEQVDPAPPRPLPEILDSPGWQAALTAGQDIAAAVTISGRGGTTQESIASTTAVETTSDEVP